MSTSAVNHWQGVYQTKGFDTVSWYRPHLSLSLELIGHAPRGVDSAVIDVGAGASTLVDDLLEAGYRDVTVADISEAALTVSRERLGPRADSVTWLAGDVLSLELAPARFDVWHDRALFHFLVDPADRRRYVALLDAALAADGQVVIATFADDGPSRCSGLDVRRYDETALAAELGPAFELVETRRESHVTPSGSEQRFLYCRFRRR